MSKFWFPSQGEARGEAKGIKQREARDEGSVAKRGVPWYGLRGQRRIPNLKVANDGNADWLESFYMTQPLPGHGPASPVLIVFHHHVS